MNFNEKGIREDFVLFVTELGTDGLEEVLNKYCISFFWYCRKDGQVKSLYY